MEENTIAFTLGDLPKIATDLLEAAKNQKVIAFSGTLGAGKTTLIGQLIKQLGYPDYMGSPTFSLVNEYRAPGLPSVFHFDAYRIKNVEEMMDMGWEEYVDTEAWLFIEWPEKIESILPDRLMIVKLHSDKSVRTLNWTIY